MRSDEFNSVKVTNDQQTFRREFGNTPRSEYLFEKDNVINIDDSANKTETVNDNVEGNAGLKTSKPDDEEIKEKLKNSNSSTGETASSSGAGAEATSVSSSAVATSAASTVSSTVATAASVVAVATVAVAAGVSVITNQNAKCRFEDFNIFTNRLEYALVLEDNEEDNFIIAVDNSNYAGKRKLEKGENYGEFTDLKSNTTYSIVVKEDKFGGKVLYDEYFTTESTSEFGGLYFDGTIDFENGSFTVSLEYFDEDNIFSDFVFNLEQLSFIENRRAYANENNVYTYNLNKTNEPQTLYINNNNEGKQVNYQDGLFAYYVSFKQKGQEIQTEPTEFHFEPKHVGPAEVYHQITWVVDSERTTISVLDGETPEYGETPTKESDEQYTYVFAGWEPTVGPAIKDETYTATFEKVDNEYVISWVNYDGSPISSEKYKIGETPIFKGDEPTRESDEQYDYAFNGWEPTISDVTGDATYKATFNAIEKTFTVRFLDMYGNELEVYNNVAYNSEIQFVGEVPDIEVEGGVYIWNEEWDKEFAPVTENVDYTAQYEFVESVTTYDIHWYIDDQLVKTTVVEEGETPYYGDDPVKDADEQYTYTFIGWSPEIVPATEEAFYHAQFDSTINAYTVTWLDGDGEVLQTIEAEYGSIPIYEGDKNPTKESDEYYNYEFSGWDPIQGIITGDTTYSPTFEESTRFYEAVWQLPDGTELANGSGYVYGQTVEYPGQTPYIEDEDFIYTFTGWDPVDNVIYGDTIYTAQFEKTPKGEFFSVTFYNEDGTYIESREYSAGEMPECSVTPQKESDEQYDYVFSGWSPELIEVTGDAEYTAVYQSVTRSYTITWAYDANNIIETEEYAYGETPEFKGQEPTKDPDEDFTYEFVGWDPELSEVTGDKTYFALFDQQEIEQNYTVTWLDWDGQTILETDTGVIDGERASYDGDTPTRDATADGYYVFSGWTDGTTSYGLNDDLPLIYGDTSFTAEYEFYEDSGQDTYMVRWFNYDDEELYSCEYVYGQIPDYSNIPTRPDDADGSYTFKGWLCDLDNEIYTNETFIAFNEDANLTAQYDVEEITQDGARITDIQFGQNASANGGDFTVTLTADGDFADLSNIKLYAWTSDNPDNQDVIELTATGSEQVNYFNRDSASGEFICDFVNNPVMYKIVYQSLDETIETDTGEFRFTTEGGTPGEGLTFVSFDASGYVLNEDNTLSVKLEATGTPVDGDSALLYVTIEDKSEEIVIDLTVIGDYQNIPMYQYFEDIDSILNKSAQIKLTYNGATWYEEQAFFTKEGGQTTRELYLSIGDQSLGESNYGFTCEVTSSTSDLSDFNNIVIVIKSNSDIEYRFNYPITQDGGSQTILLSDSSQIDNPNSARRDLISGSSTVWVEYVDPEEGTQTKTSSIYVIQFS